MATKVKINLTGLPNLYDDKGVLNTDLLAEMHLRYPENFEILRKLLIEDAISKSPPESQALLRAQQSSLDRILEGHTPIEREIITAQWLAQKLSKLSECMETLVQCAGTIANSVNAIAKEVVDKKRG